MDFIDIVDITTPNGNITKIQEQKSPRRILWEKTKYISSVIYKGHLSSNIFCFAVNGESMPRYRIFINTDSPWSSLNYNVSYKSNGIECDTSAGVIYSNNISWDENNAIANEVGSRNFNNGSISVSTVVSGKTIGLTTGAIIYKNSVSPKTPSELPTGYTPRVRGIPEAATIVGGSGKLEFIWIGLKPYETLDFRVMEDVYAIPSSYVTLKAISKNISVSGTTVKVNSAGLCALSVSVPGSGGSGTETIEYRWPAKAN